MFLLIHLALFHIILFFRMLILFVIQLFELVNKAFSLLIIRMFKAALDLFRFRAAQRVFVYLPETDELHRGMIVICYDDGCMVNVQVSKHPRVQREYFYTHEQLATWNPKQKREQPPGAAALVVLPIVLTADYAWGLLALSC
jgi:hypothetical protein